MSPNDPTLQETQAAAPDESNGPTPQEPQVTQSDTSAAAPERAPNGSPVTEGTPTAAAPAEPQP
ncbi:MAG: hypothetical protein WBC44_22690, partial [Planctomycetaceae bacterium]